jgi:hypothetical protein
MPALISLNKPNGLPITSRLPVKCMIIENKLLL